jgi:hypothetical protein
MFKKTMTFDNLEGEEVTQTFYFNYTKKEIMELIELKDLELKFKLLSTSMEDSGLSNTENNRQAYTVFEDLILDAYGEKSTDNVTFVKNDRTREYFKNHVAFSDMVFEFIADPNLMQSFIENCLPPKLVSQAKEELAKEHKGELKGATLREMVAEAEERQKDPATRIEPGPEAAREALGDPEPLGPVGQRIADQVTQDIFGGGAQEGPTPVGPDEEHLDYDKISREDILAMNKDALDKLEPRKLSPSQMQAAYSRRMQL